MFGLGCLKSPPDSRDYMYRQIMKAEPLPTKFSRRSSNSQVRNQGGYGTCVGFAAAAVKDEQEGRDWNANIVTSPLYIYKRCKALDGIPTEEGTYPRVAMKVLAEYGVCQEATFPYLNMTWPVMPLIPTGADKEAAGFKVGAYASLLSLYDVKQAIVQSGNVLAGVMLCESFRTVGPDGLVPVPGENGPDSWLGGHALCVCGYDDDLTNGKHMGYLQVKNSWDTTWGDGGYCWIPYDYFLMADNSMGGFRYWMESWSSVDIITPDPVAQDIVMYLDSDVAIVDGLEVQMDCAPVVDYEIGRTFVPLRFISERFGYKVDWDGTLKKIHIYK